MSKYLELAKKINELAKRGVGGEREAAELQLKRLMSKHGITMEEIEGEELTEHRVRCDKEDFKFLRQVIASVRGNTAAAWHLNYGYFDCTAAEFAEIDVKFRFYKVRLKEVYKAAYSAFIQVNSLYRFETDEERKARYAREQEEGLEETEEDRKAAEIARGLRPEKYHKQLK